MSNTPINKKEAKKKKKEEKQVLWADNRTFKFTAPRNSDILAKESVLIGGTIINALSIGALYHAKDTRIKMVAWVLSVASFIFTSEATGCYELKRNIANIDKQINEAYAKTNDAATEDDILEEE